MLAKFRRALDQAELRAAIEAQLGKGEQLRLARGGAPEVAVLRTLGRNEDGGEDQPDAGPPEGRPADQETRPGLGIEALSPPQRVPGQVQVGVDDQEAAPASVSLPAAPATMTARPAASRGVAPSR